NKARVAKKIKNLQSKLSAPSSGEEDKEDTPQDVGLANTHSPASANTPTTETKQLRECISDFKAANPRFKGQDFLKPLKDKLMSLEN
ncbi:hypothetical protein H0H93_007355, partial [Arthromyces matolae]